MIEKAPPKYQYDPSLAAAAIFAALFGLTAACHFVQLVRNRTWYFVPFFIGTVFEVVGYGARGVNASQTPDWTTVPFIVQTLLPLLAPALFAASIYMVLGRIIKTVDAEHLSFIPTRWLTKIFVFGDILSFFVQCIGGGILAGADSKSKVDLGQNVILVGLAIQILFFGCFIAAISVFHYRILRQPTAIILRTTLPWKNLVLVLYFASVLILARSIFRIAEFAAGQRSALQTSEAYLYCFDSTLMFLCSLAFNIWHPGQVVSPRNLKAVVGIDLDDTDMPRNEEQDTMQV